MIGQWRGLAAALALIPASVLAEEPAAKAHEAVPCFDIVSAFRGKGLDHAVILIDRCTGKTWALDPPGFAAGTAFSWIPVKHD